jgi:hypothetical protein
MKLFPLILGLLLGAMAFDLGRALVTHSGVGPLEWVVGLGLLVALVLGVAGFARRSFRIS